MHKNRVHGLNDDSLLAEILSSGVEFMIIPDASTSDYVQHKILADNNIKCGIRASSMR